MTIEPETKREYFRAMVQHSTGAIGNQLSTFPLAMGTFDPAGRLDQRHICSNSAQKQMGLQAA